jgi:4-hydroxy-tetrahydrodipicolinate synthase
MRKAVDPKDAAVLSGLAEFFYSMQSLYGSPGFVSGTANFAPDLSYSVYEAVSAGDFGKAADIVRFLDPFSSFNGKVTANHGPHTGAGLDGGIMGFAVTKAAMDIVGLRGGEVRLPLVGLTDKEKTELKKILAKMNLA